MRRAQQGPVRVDEASSASAFRELDDAFLQTQTKIWLGEVLHLRFDEDVLVADLLADGELLFQVSKIIWKRLLRKNREQLKQSKVYIYERISFGRSNGKYMPYSKVDSFLKICQILGLAGIDLFTPSDVVEKRNVRKVPDFDIVTYTISMPNYIVGGICRSLEQPQYSSSGSSGYSPHAAGSKELQQQASSWKGLFYFPHLLNIYSSNEYVSRIIFDGQNDQHGDTHYDSDEAESRLSILEPEDSVDEDSFAAVHLQLTDVPKEESEGGGENGHDMHEEKSLAESVGSLDFDVMGSESLDSTPLIRSKESWSTHSATDQCSRTGTTKYSLSSEELDSVSSHLAFHNSKNDSELNNHPAADSEMICNAGVKSQDHSIHGGGQTLTDADHPIKESANLQKDTGTIIKHCDVIACDRDRESVCSSFEEPRYGLNGESSDLSSESYSGLTATRNTGDKLPMVSEDVVNNVEPSIIGAINDRMIQELNPESCTTNQMDGSQSADKQVESEHIAKDSIAPQRPEDAPKSGKGVLKSVAGGITLVGAVFFMVHLRRNKERSFAAVIPSLSEKPVQRDSRAKNMNKENVPDVYPEGWLKYSNNRGNMELLSIILIIASLLPFSASDRQGDALYDMKLKLNATSSQLTDWNQNQVNPCTWNSVICDSNNNVVQVTLASMGFTGVLSPRIGELEYLNVLSLPGNNITGGIPEQFGNLSRLTSLDLENNLLIGPIPASLGRLSRLQLLILSQNNLNGSIPDTLASISSLTDIRLAYNKLTGQIPPQLFQVARSSRGSKIGIVLGTVAGVMGLLILGAVFIICNGRKKSHLREIFVDVSGEDDRRIAFGQLRRFAWRELQLATDNFNEKNVLGQGGFGKVYKGALPDGTKVAVKRLTDYESPGGEAAFLREVELISVAVHRNLLRLIGFCTTQTERLLVYPFMQNLSVAYRLREFKPGEPILDWSARKRVAIGTARGLEYLHEHCNPKIIHRDVKAANVLLDEGFEPVVGDFGLAKLVDVQKTSVTTQVRGTMGHIAPEYLSTGKSSERTDVFGYGIMLLELVTGQRAIDFSRLEEEDDVLLLDHVKKLQREGHLDAIVDRNLNSNYNGVEVEMMIQIALLCTQASPEDRPSMSEVVRMLEGEGLAERWEEWQQVEVTRRQDYERMQQRFDWGEDSIYNQDAIELSAGR
ncbi:hypothetical protein U9M48_010271 [Paspalum notatum var. saurae]|uniref:non-specific serine/threonine protein kinase n=1 Tax=Paspalum notatum var. saurae TaxID=547442 RepID=A0AAQ3WG00_PASNO